MKQSPLLDVDYLRGFDLAQEVNALIRRARQGSRSVREVDNIVNYRWYCGQPYYRRVADTTKVVGLAPDQRQKYLSINKSFEICRTLKGIMWYEPDVEANPLTADGEDIARAQMAEAVGKHVIDRGKLGLAYDRVLDNCNICGCGIIKAGFDSTKGSRRPTHGLMPCPQCQGACVLQNPLTGIQACPTCSAQGMVMGPGGRAQGAGVVSQFLGKEAEGQVVFDSVHPNDVFVDPEAAYLEDTERIVHRIKMSRHKAWRTIGRAAGMHEKDFIPTHDVEDNVYTMASIGPQFQRSAEEESVYAYEYWSQPTEDHPDGVYGVVIGNQAVIGGPLPDISDTHWSPFFFFPMYEVEGALYPFGTMDLILPLVIALNDHMSILQARARLSAKLRWSKSRESRAEIDEKSGNMEWSARGGGVRPEPLAFAPYPQDASNIIDILTKSIGDIAAANEVNKGNNQDQATSARMLAFLEERSVGPLKPVMARHARVLDDVAKYGIDLARVHYDDGRLMRIPGESGTIEVQAFMAENCGEGTDVRSSVVRSAGRSRATMMAELNEAATNQMIDQETYVELAEFGELPALYKERRIPRDEALMEHRILDQHGYMPQPGKYQNHAIHGKEHRKKLSMIRLNNPQDPRIPFYEQHIEWTVMMDAQEQVAQQQAMAQASAQFGQINAADPKAQPQSTQQTAGVDQSAENYQNNTPGPPGTQQSLQQAASTAKASDASIQPQGSPQ